MLTSKVARHLQTSILLSCFVFTYFKLRKSFDSIPKEIEFVGDHPSAPELPRWTSCRIELTDYLMPLHQQWYMDGYPVLQSVVIQEEHTKVSFIVKHMADHPATRPNRRKRYEEVHAAKWMCNDKTPAKVLGSDRQFQTLTLMCPSDELEFITYAMESKSFHANYSLSKHMECERNFPIPFQPNSTLALCTMIRETPRNDILQWIEYHRLIGFDSFIFYVNEDYHNGTATLPKDDPSILYIPWGYQVRKKIKKKDKQPVLLKSRFDWFHQEVQQSDCLYRTAQQHIPWVALSDTDEYIRLSPNETSLLDFLETYTIDGDETYSGIKIKNQFYGGKNGKEELKLDYVWKHPHTTGSKYRTKLIVHPDQVHYINVHAVGSGKDARVVEDQARLVHYKNAERGVFHEEKGDLDFVYDTSFRDAFRSKLVESLKKYS